MHAQSAEAVIDTQPPVSGKRGPDRRLAWLDALRGFAALCVVFDHGSTLLLQPVRDYLYQVLNLGQYGVFVFFLVSGYIIPASLERKGSVRSFWVSRGFRLYPMFLVSIALSAVAYYTGFGTVDGAEKHPLTSVASWAVMLPNLLTGANVPNVTWTLSYEMVFYLLLAALFSWNAHRRSGTYALTSATGALVLGAVLPMGALTAWAGASGRLGGHGDLALVVLADVIILAGIVLAATERGRLTRIGATVAAVAALVLMLFNQTYPYPWSGGTILALMFTGTLIYRAEQGQVRKPAAAAITAAVLALTVAAGLVDGWSYGGQWRWQWVSSLVLAAATFGLGLAGRRFFAGGNGESSPRARLSSALAWLGLVSYSVYLLHPLVFDAYRDIPVLHQHHPAGIQLLLAAGILAVVLGVSAAGYYGVEKPMQKLGRKTSKRLAARQKPLSVPAKEVSPRG